MKYNKIISLIIILLIIFITLLNFNTIIYGADVVENPEHFNPKDNAKDEVLLKGKAQIILGYINVIGVILSVITISIVGLKYMFGSVEEKAEYKKTVVMYLLGAFLLFSVTTIPNILYNVSQSIEGSQVKAPTPVPEIK